MTLPYEKSHIPLEAYLHPGTVFWDYEYYKEFNGGIPLKFTKIKVGGRADIIAAMKLKKLKT